MKPDIAGSHSSETRPTPTRRLPGQITSKKLLLAMAIAYGIWLLYMAYVAWINVQAGNQ